MRIHEILRSSLLHVGQTLTVEGWIRTSRFSKRVTFVHLYDGSTTKTLQVVLSPPADEDLRRRLSVGAAVKVSGMLVESSGAEQPIELSVRPEDLVVVGDCDASIYPVQKKEATLEFYREIPHLRPRTMEMQRVFLARNAASMAIHQFLQTRGFLWVHAPILTASDCEGAGEMFHVATPTKDLRRLGRPVARHPEPGEGIAEVVARAADDERPWPEPPLDDGAFFGKPTFLTVSGQLEVEALALAFGRVYSFGPTFRAENSNTARHASEFWMVEPEMAFSTKDDVMDLTEGLVRAVAESVEQPLPATPFARITYTEAQAMLEKSDVTFRYPVGWGCPLQTEHERFLAGACGGPVFVTDYPKEHKSFYMRLNDDGRTVGCFDLLVPGVGEIVGGSAREEREPHLRAQMERCGIDPAAYEEYLDLRRFGSVPHGGFGLGLERILMWLLDVPNIRDVIPYPRTPGTI